MNSHQSLAQIWIISRIILERIVNLTSTPAHSVVDQLYRVYGKVVKMWKGEVIGIFIRPEESQPTQEVNRVRAVQGRGLEGDYFFNLPADQDKRSDSGREITLIEVEALQAIYRDYNVALERGESRRNILTRGIHLNYLVGKEFKVGEATLLGIRLCEPCSHLARLTQKKVLPSLVHRGGLRAEILTGGTIQTGDTVYIVEHSSEKEVLDA